MRAMPLTRPFSYVHVMDCRDQFDGQLIGPIRRRGDFGMKNLKPAAYFEKRVVGVPGILSRGLLSPPLAPGKPLCRNAPIGSAPQGEECRCGRTHSSHTRQSFLALSVDSPRFAEPFALLLLRCR